MRTDQADWNHFCLLRGRKLRPPRQWECKQLVSSWTVRKFAPVARFRRNQHNKSIPEICTIQARLYNTNRPGLSASLLTLTRVCDRPRGAIYSGTNNFWTGQLVPSSGGAGSYLRIGMHSL